MTSAKWIGPILAIFVSFGVAHAQDFTSVATEDLIGKLQEVSDQGTGTNATASPNGFVAIDDEPTVHVGSHRSIKFTISPVMRELVRRGVAALPALIGHLTDARPTKLAGDRRAFLWFGKEYDPRDRDPAKLPAGVDRPRADSGGLLPTRGYGHYTAKVGDLCFVAVGQIVNRQLQALRYQPCMCVVVNSPVKTPALAAAVKADWGGLTPAAHRRSLEEDALRPSTLGLSVELLDAVPESFEAVKRLMFYYPEAGAPIAVRLLNAPLRDIPPETVTAKDGRKRDRRIAGSGKKIGRGCLPTMPPGASKQLDRLDRLLADFAEDNNFQTMHDLVDALAAFPSQTIDGAVCDLLIRTSETHPVTLVAIYDRCNLVHACAIRLTKPADREGFEKSYAAVMSSLPKKPISGEEPQSGEMMAFAKRFQAYLDDEIGRLAPWAL